MSTNIQFSGSIPQIYDRMLGPFLFDWSAERLGQRVRADGYGRVLELSAGTGISTDALRRHLPQTVGLIASDINEDMLDLARSRPGTEQGVSFRIIDAQELPFEDETLDAVVCQFGLMFFPDPAAALREALRVLKPGGQLLFSVWDSLDRNPPVRTVQDLLVDLFPDDPPRFLETPFGMHDHEQLRALFESAGAREVRIETCEHTAELGAARTPAEGLVRGNPGVIDLEARATLPIERIVDAAEERLAARYGTRPFQAPLSAIFIDARRAGSAL